MRGAPLALILLLLAACGGGGSTNTRVDEKPRATVPPALAALRTAHDTFQQSPGTADDFATLTAAVKKVRPALARPATAEADIVLAAASARMLGERFEQGPDDEDGVLAATVLPLAYGFRMLDGESIAQFRDRLCDGPAKTECAGALPEFWGRALTYGAAGRVLASVGEAPAKCACEAQYRVHLGRMQELAEHGVARQEVERRFWALEQDPLPKTAFGVAAADPGEAAAPVPVRISAEGVVDIAGSEVAATGGARQQLASFVAALTTARGQTPPEQAVVEITAPGTLPTAVVATLCSAAQGAGFAAVTLVVRQAAPPHYRAWLVFGLAQGKAPKDVAGLWFKPRELLQATVDRVDVALGAAENVQLVLVVPR